MEDRYPSVLTDEERAARRAQRAAARREKEKARRRKRLLQLLPALLLCALLAGLLSAWSLGRSPAEETPGKGSLQTNREAKSLAGPFSAAPAPPYSAAGTGDTLLLGESLPSAYGVLIDLDAGTILAEKDARTVIPPASMTKILTLLVAAESVTDLEDTFTITREIADYCFVNDCSVVGFEVEETVTVRDLLYGTILPSGADAALGLACYVSGSQEAFVALMNEKLADLGLSDTAHFTNCVGLFEDGHACTVYDVAMILKAALDNPLCREILSARTYQSSATAQHPEGQILSNWFLRRIEDKDAGTVEVLSAKTGYVAQSGSCAASYGENAGGKGYLCVTAGAYSPWRCIYDHVDLYSQYCN